MATGTEQFADTHHDAWWKWPFVAAIVGLLMSSGLAVLQYTRFLEASARVEHTYDVLAVIDGIVARMVDAETAYRGYLLTADRRFLQPYLGVDTEVQARMAALSNLVGDDDPTGQQAAKRLQALAGAKLAEMSDVIALYDGGDAEGANARVVAGQDERLMDQIREVSSQIRASQPSLLSQLDEQVVLTRRGLTALTGFSVVVAIVLSVLGVFIERTFKRLVARERVTRVEAERATRFKDDFVQSVSHELRTPLNAILGWVGVLKQNQEAATLAKAIDVIDRNSHRQSQMIDDLLDMREIRPGKLRLDVQRVEISRAIEGALVAAQRAADAEGSRLQVGELLRNVVVLVLDDEPDARDLLERLLEDVGASVTLAGSAPEALSALERGLLPDIILSDIGLPGQDGYEFLLHVRRMPGPVRAVPAAALSALARLEDRRRALLSGYQAHLVKPFDPTELIATVASLTGRTGRPLAD